MTENDTASTQSADVQLYYVSAIADTKYTEVATQQQVAHVYRFLQHGIVCTAYIQRIIRK